VRTGTRLWCRPGSRRGSTLCRPDNHPNASSERSPYCWAKSFIKSFDLSGTPRGILAQDAATEAGEVFDKAKAQAQVLGSGVFSFAQGQVPPVAGPGFEPAATAWPAL
jgi:hypothetical protein